MNTSQSTTTPVSPSPRRVGGDEGEVLCFSFCPRKSAVRSAKVRVKILIFNINRQKIIEIFIPVIGGQKAMKKRQVAPWDPFREMMTPWEEDLFGGDFSPSADVYQDKNNVIVEMETPGIESDKLDISVENDVLTVSGSKEDKKETKREDYYRRELRSGSFSRSVILPMEVKGDKASAEVKNGILKVTLPKADQRKPKRIKVKANK